MLFLAPLPRNYTQASIEANILEHVAHVRVCQEHILVCCSDMGQCSGKSGCNPKLSPTATRKQLLRRKYLCLQSCTLQAAISWTLQPIKAWNEQTFRNRNVCVHQELSKSVFFSPYEFIMDHYVHSCYRLNHMSRIIHRQIHAKDLCLR